MMGELPAEWKNNIVIHKYKISDKQKVENCRGISLLNACHNIYSRVLNGKLKAQAEQFLWNATMDSEKADLASIHC
jgi:hypothetical protein